MKAFTHWIVRRYVADYRDVDNIKVRARYGSLEAWTSIIINVVLFVVKGALALSISSVALLADAIHTLSDSGTSIIILIGFKIAKRPSDREHPFGHGRMESVATFIVAILLILAGFELLRSAVGRIWHPTVEITKIKWTLTLILCGTMVIKELMARFAREMAIMIKSKTLEADFWHHRCDALSTALVLVAMAGSYFEYQYVDGVMGLCVALIVMYSGYAIARAEISPLLGERPQPELLAEIESSARQVPGVQGVHDVIVHRYGQVNLVSLHIEVSESEPIVKLHDISERVEEVIGEKLGGSAVVHIDPLNKAHKRYDEIHDLIEQAIIRDKRIVSFHDLRITGKDEEVCVTFDITVEQDIAEQKVADLKQQLCGQLREKLPGVELAIKAEPRYAYSR